MNDDHIRPDIRSVMRAADHLDVTEFELFHLAYARWHGERADEQRLEPFFIRYMFGGVVPPWVRHFARHVEHLERRGRLDRYALGVHRRPRSQQMVNRGLRYGVIVGLVLTSLIVVTELLAEAMGLSVGCMFPPCY